MKNAVLASLLLLSISNVFGITVEKDGVSIKYKKDLQYRMIKPGSYSIKITNHSNRPIVVDPSIISAPLVAYQEITKISINRLKVAKLILTPIAAGLGLFLYSLAKQDSNVPSTTASGTKQVGYGTDWKKIILVSTIVGGFFVASFLATANNAKAIEAKLEEESLHSPTIIQPGQSVEKLFWLQNPNDQVKINFDAIKVLK